MATVLVELDRALRPTTTAVALGKELTEMGHMDKAELDKEHHLTIMVTDTGKAELDKARRLTITVAESGKARRLTITVADMGKAESGKEHNHKEAQVLLQSNTDAPLQVTITMDAHTTSEMGLFPGVRRTVSEHSGLKSCKCCRSELEVDTGGGIRRVMPPPSLVMK
jgi:hypothetical protein